jgi:endonuclease-3
LPLTVECGAQFSYATQTPFAIDVAMARIREAIRPFPQAALFALAVEEFSSPFELLVICIISIRTLNAIILSRAHRS